MESNDDHRVPPGEAVGRRTTHQGSRVGPTMRTRLRGGRDLKRERESDLPDPPVITDINLRGLVELGLKSSKGPEMAFGPGASPEELLQHQAEEERAQEERIKAAE